MYIRLFKFPTRKDGISAIEKKYVELYNEYKRKNLSREELDWMDWAQQQLEKKRRA